MDPSKYTSCWKTINSIQIHRNSSKYQSYDRLNTAHAAAPVAIELMILSMCALWKPLFVFSSSLMRTARTSMGGFSPRRSARCQRFALSMPIQGYRVGLVSNNRGVKVSSDSLPHTASSRRNTVEPSRWSSHPPGGCWARSAASR